MKHKLTILAVLLMALTMPVLAQKKKVAKDPDHAQWVIKASMNSGIRNGQAEYWIDSVTSKGIFFKQEDRYAGDYNSYTEKVSFIFKDAYTIPDKKINDGLILWTKNTKGKWVQDAEKTENKLKIDSTKILTVVMVLDCSGSMSEGGSDNFERMKSSALQFVDTLWHYSRSGNIHVGVVGFNTTAYADRHTLKPTPLNAGNYSIIRNHIKGLESIEGAGTALYYSIDKALQLLIDDYDAIIDKNIYNGSALVSFTDGKDNLSKDIKKGITSLKGYLKHMQQTFCDGNVIIGGKPVYKRLIGFRGQNVDMDEWNSMVEDVQSVFCKDNAFIPITKIDELNTEFSKIAKKLIQSTMSLACQVPSAITGPVAWTIPEYGKVRKPSNFWMGLNLSYEYGDYANYYSYYPTKFESSNVSLGIDMAWPITSKLELGGTANLGYNFNKGFLSLKIGPLAKITFGNNSAFLFGAGHSTINYGLYVDLGYKFKLPWYLKVSVYPNTTFDEGFGFGLSIGYSIFSRK